MPSFVGSAIAHANDDLSKTPDFSGVGWAEGDLAIATCWRAVTSGYFSPPDSSWIALGSRSDSNASARAGRVFYKILQSGADETPTFTLFNSTASAPSSVVISIWTGVSESNPLDGFSLPLTHHLNDATPTPNPVTTLTANAQMVLWHGAYYATSFSGGAPSGYTLRVDYSGATYDDRQQFLADKTVASAGTETPGDWTHTASPGTTEEGAQQSVALRGPQVGDFPEVWELAKTESGLATTHALAFPGTVLAGDLLLLIAWVRAAVAVAISSAPTGFTRIDSGSTQSNARLWAGWKSAAGNESGGTVGISTDINTTCVSHIFRIRGWDVSNPPEYAETSGFSSDPPNITPSWGADDNLYMGIMANLGVEALAPSPLNWRHRSSRTTPDIALHTARLESVAGSLNVADWYNSTTGSTAGGLAAMIAIQGDVVPVGGGGPGGTVGVGSGWGISI